jgi:hypothetical protein
MQHNNNSVDDDDAEARAKAGFYRAQLMLTQIGIKIEITVIEH